MPRPLAGTGSLGPAFAPAWIVFLAVKLPYALALCKAITIGLEGTFERLRYSLGGNRPS